MIFGGFHDIDIEYNALPMTAFLGRPYRTFKMGLRFIPRVETRGYEVDRPCRDFKTRFTRKRSFDHDIPHLSRVSHPWKGFASWELLVYQNHLHITGLRAPFRVYRAYG